ncbi:MULTISPECIES: hypothetical protein [Pseudomonas]|nr:MULTISPECIES: hypothetical protein [Pseudomonas]MCO7595013.1 hypothetical protein [Pseudomonas guariconensis]MCU7221108.1 hypothetical protein [Pseudomonas brassicacearum]
MARVRVKRLSIGSAAGTALYDEHTCKPLYADQIGPKAFKVTLTDGNYDHSGDPLDEGQFEMETEVGFFHGYANEQMPGLGLPETIILTLIAE